MIRFQTPEAELQQRRNEWRKNYPSPVSDAGALVSRLYASAPFDLSITRHPEQDFAAWQSRGGSLLRETLEIPGSLGVPCAPEILSRTATEDYWIEEIEFTATPPLRVPATVVIPRNGGTRHPAVVALHSMGGLRAFGREKLLAFEGEPSFLTEYRKTCYDGRSVQAELARRGYLSIAIDAINFGLRTADADCRAFPDKRRNFSTEEARDFTQRASLEDENRLQRLLGVSGMSLAALVATDDLRTVDYLASRDDVDAARIACAGLSMGAFRANYLSALDSRIRTAVSVCWLTTLAGIVDYNPLGAMGFFALPPGLYRRMDLPDIVALSAPKPFLAISGWQDPLMQPAGIADAHLALRKVWERASNVSAFGSLVHDKPHEFNREMQETALDFLDCHLTDASSAHPRITSRRKFSRLSLGRPKSSQRVVNPSSAV